ncbi:MAG: hypothetical protein ACI8RD_013417 [Bacillariaceae sp.]|jgi:hypothetical protein
MIVMCLFCQSYNDGTSKQQISSNQDEEGGVVWRDDAIV